VIFVSERPLNLAGGRLFQSDKNDFRHSDLPIVYGSCFCSSILEVVGDPAQTVQFQCRMLFKQIHYIEVKNETTFSMGVICDSMGAAAFRKHAIDYLA
jgi:hypothetical protein